MWTLPARDVRSETSFSVASHAAVREELKTKLFEHHKITPKRNSVYVHQDFLQINK